VFIPDPKALDEGELLIRNIKFKLRLDSGDVVIPRVRIEHRAGKSAFRPVRRRRRGNVPLVRSSGWAYRDAMKRSFSRKIREIVTMVAGVRAHRNLTLWRDPDNLMIWHGRCDDCGLPLWVGPGFWMARPGSLTFRGRAFIDTCASPQERRKPEPKPKPEPFSRLFKIRP
jgi:hypothetical protein